MHVMEPPDLWERYIAAEWRHAAPIGLSELHRDMRVRVKDHSLTRMGRAKPNFAETVGWKPGSDEAFASSEASRWDPASQLAAMDEEGVDVAVLFPSRGLFVLGLDSTDHVGADGLEPGLAAAIARGYNDWMADYCSASPRLLGAGLLAPHDVDAAVDEVQRCIETLGFATVFMLPGLVNGRAWHDPAYDPIWRACEALGVPVCFHGGGQNYLQPDYTLEFDNLMMWHTFGQPVGIMAVTVSITAGGVLQRFPELRVGLLEGQLRMGAVVARSSRRALGVGGRQGRPRARPRAVRVLPIELLPEHRGGRASGALLRRLVRGRQPRLLDRLPARRFEVSRVGVGVPGAPHRRGNEAQGPVGELVPALRDADLRRGFTPGT